jgi:hypothetical protein
MALYYVALNPLFSRYEIVSALRCRVLPCVDGLLGLEWNVYHRFMGYCSPV